MFTSMVAARANRGRRVDIRDSRAWRRVPLLTLVLLAAGFLALGVAEAWSDAPTFDEPVYVSAGLAGILHHDVTLNDEHPPLPKALAALPVLFTHPAIPANGSWSGNDEQAYATRFLAAQLAAGHVRPVTFASRLVPLAETAAVAFVLFALAMELFGSALAGLLAGALWLASPLVLGIGHLDGVDIPFALATVLSSWALVRWLRRRTWRALGGLGLAFAAVAGSQISGLAVVACGLAVVLVAETRRQWPVRGWPAVGRIAGAIALPTLIGLAGLWLGYLVLDPAVITQPAVVLPRPYLDGLHFLATQDTQPAAGFVAGVAYQGGRWWFWPVSLVIKWPLASLLLLLAGLVACCWRPRSDRRAAGWGVGLPAAALAAFYLATPRDVGLRYLLPTLALAAALAGALVPLAARWRPVARRTALAGVAVASALTVAATAASFPQSLAWTTWPFRPAYTAVTDSNVDWGQGLYALSAWSAAHHPYLLYFGPRGVDTTTIPGSRALPADPAQHVTGWVAVSVTALNSSNRAELSWLRRWCPVRVLDGSILLYRFREPPGGVAAAGSAVSPPVCPGSWSSVPASASGPAR
ncbi:MAG TPA: glycosyltransferase family 39 protein [Streptosporangiaceae bacterium]|nr:glycosyltransferase family 39 protein [Streptosporangiaceae bacterium]